MIKYFTAILLIPIISFAADIDTLLTAASQRPEIKSLKLSEDISRQEKAKTLYNFTPKVDFYASYEYSSRPQNLVPLTPDEMDVSKSLPISENIYSYGVKASMPVFVKELFDTADILKLKKEKFGILAEIAVIKNQSLLVSLNSYFHYLNKKREYLQKRIESLKKTKKIVQTGVDAGRIPKSELYNISKSVLELKMEWENLNRQTEDVKADIYKITGRHINKPVRMERGDDFDKIFSNTAAGFIQLEPYKYDIKTAKQEIEKEKAYRYPKVNLTAAYTQNMGESYNKGEFESEDIGNVMVELSIPIFDAQSQKEVAIAKNEMLKAKQDYLNRRSDLSSLKEKYSNKLPIIKKSIRQAEEDIVYAKKLLNTAKVAYKNRRMTVDDYLSYEVDVLKSESNLAALKNEKWQIYAGQALLYGIKLTEVVK
ncbi:MAG: TolC family protein [Flexistipes sinusarabici]|uniref:TolC family protein n=1 Tax=Flexistipes sinusarabici TaxID=2352 RepID=A0A5D0MIX2_FLESI|nr:TolC family protein [Flexistipes sinusarabici]TYB32322.1 MAG: TolC family protein [Flexistipes sinusarabici]